MSEMVERVALAICRGRRYGCDGECSECQAGARLAIAAMREPTEKMIAAPFEAELDIYWAYTADGRPGGPEDVWRAMIDAAIAEVVR